MGRKITKRNYVQIFAALTWTMRIPVDFFQLIVYTHVNRAIFRTRGKAHICGKSNPITGLDRP